MTIKISQFDTKPALEYSRILISELRLIDPEVAGEKMRLRVTYKPFGKDAQGKKFFSTAQYTVTLDNVPQTEAAWTAGGDNNLKQMLNRIELVVARLISEAGTFGVADLEP